MMRKLIIPYHSFTEPSKIPEQKTYMPVGYALLSFAYATELCGLVVWIEELYISETCRTRTASKTKEPVNIWWIIKSFFHN